MADSDGGIHVTELLL